MSRQRKLLPAADEGTFERICAQLNPEWIEAALAATGTATVRRRRLPAEQVIWLVLGMALYRHRPITDLVERLELVLPGAGAIAPSSVAQARNRLGSRTDLRCMAWTVPPLAFRTQRKIVLTLGARPTETGDYRATHKLGW